MGQSTGPLSIDFSFKHCWLEILQSGTYDLVLMSSNDSLVPERDSNGDSIASQWTLDIIFQLLSLVPSQRRRRPLLYPVEAQRRWRLYNTSCRKHRWGQHGRAGINNYILSFLWCMITLTCPIYYISMLGVKLIQDKKRGSWCLIGLFL